MNLRGAVHLPAHLTRSYRVVQPLRSHFQRIDCEQAECEAWRHGFAIPVDTRTELGGQQLKLVRESRRRYAAVDHGDGRVTFRFPPGTQCFKVHHRSLGRPAYFAEVDGQRPREPRKHNADTWQDSFANHQDKLAEEADRG